MDPWVGLPVVGALEQSQVAVGEVAITAAERDRCRVRRESGAGSIGGGLGFDDLSLLDSSPWEAGDFEASEDGGTKETDVTFLLVMNLNNGDDTVEVAQRSTTTTFTVHNDDSTAETGGHGDGTVKGENQDP